MKRVLRVFALLLVVTLCFSLSSCHSKRETRRAQFKPHKEKRVKVNEDEYEEKRVESSDDSGWATLDIKLTRHDNKALYKECRSWLGTPYLYGGSTRDGADCSGFVMEVYKEVYAKKIERNSARIFERNCHEISKKKLREGDLVFFNNGRSSRISHVGLYLKDGKFIHASSSRGVMVSDLEQRYWVTHFQCAGRVQ